MECKVKKNKHFRQLFVFIQGSKAEKAADFYSGDSTNKKLKILLNIEIKL